MTAATMPAPFAVQPQVIRRILALAIAVLLIAGLASAYRLSTRTSPVTLYQAVTRFRASAGHDGGAQVAAGQPAAVAAAPAGAAAPAISGHPSGTGGPAPIPPGGPAPSAAATVTPHLPVAGVRPAPPAATPSAPPGVYTYATDGSERVSALGGQSHSYPSRTTMTVTSTGCGTDVRWDALQQRYDEWQLCTAGSGLQLRSLTTYHDFFSQVDKRVYECTPETRFRPDSTVAGTTFGGRCTANGAAAALSGSVIGIEQVTVGSTTVPALHVHLDEQLTGATSGTRSGDSWYALSDNLLLRRTSSTEADTQTSFGPTHYHEAVRLALSDLHPAT